MANAKCTAPALVPAVSYVRMSSDKQDKSPEQQRDEITKLAERGGYSVAREFLDPGITGDSIEARPQFCEMLVCVTNGGPKTILAWDQDRIGRFDSLSAGSILTPLRKAGVRIVTCCQGLLDLETFEGRVSYMVRQEGKHAFLRDLSHNCCRGHLDGAARGEWQGGPTPFGYGTEPIPDAPVRKNGTRPMRLTVDPEAASVVRRIFALFASGKSAHEIADMLNREGIPAPHGGKWRLNRITRMVKKRVYLGESRYGDTPIGKYHRATAAGPQPVNGNGTGNHPAADPVVVKGTHEPLVSVADFERCQRFLVERASAKSPYRPGDNPYLLSGLVKCAHCGGGMVGTTNKGPSRLYECASYHTMGKSVCRKHTLREDTVVRLLIGKLQEHFEDIGNEKQLRDEIRRQCAPQPTCTADTAKLQTRIGKLSKQIDMGAEKLLAAPAELTPILTTKLQQWQKERDDLRHQLQAHQRPADATLADVEEIIDAAIGELRALRERLTVADPVLLREVLRQFVVKVELWFADPPTSGKGKRFRSVPQRGLIHLRPDVRLIKLVPSDSSLGQGRPCASVVP